MTKPRAHYFQHVSFEGLGSTESWLLNSGFAISATPFFDADHQLPEGNEIDLLIVLGGSMSVNDEQQYPWLAAEKQFIREQIAAGKPVLGICLGAQLIAASQGAKIYPNHEAEIGWFPIQGDKMDDSALFQFPTEQLVFHWHGETFDLPDGATLLASSYGCKNQAFQLGSNVIGLQFHLETTPTLARALVKHCGDELKTGDFIQSPGQILFANNEKYDDINLLMARVLAHITLEIENA